MFCDAAYDTCDQPTSLIYTAQIGNWKGFICSKHCSFKFGDGGVEAVEAGRRISIENPVGRCGRQFLHPPLLVGGEWGEMGGEGWPGSPVGGSVEKWILIRI